jgi:hypothetical protein
MKNQPALAELNALIDQTLEQLNGMNSNDPVELNRMRQTAKNVLGGAPDLSQRQVTSTAGQIGQAVSSFFRFGTDLNAGIVQRPAGSVFVPGKGIILPPLYSD